MIRAAVLCLLGIALLLAVAPFALSSLLVDQRGVAVTGHVFSKDEWIVVRDSIWKRNVQVVVEYEPPQESGVAFLKAEVPAERFDELKKGDAVSLRYLRREDLPHLPGVPTLRQMHLLPRVRLADQRAWSGLQSAFGSVHAFTVATIAAVVLILTVWRLARAPFFAWAIAACVLAAVVVTLIHEFPVPTPSPQRLIRSGKGTVKSVERLEWLFRGGHEMGFKADQPIQIVGVQFVPEGRTEPVVAVDLIDAAGMREQTSVIVQYESDNPRVAHIQGATRQFVRRNLRGIATELMACLLVIVVLLIAAHFMGKGYRRLTQGSAT